MSEAAVILAAGGGTRFSGPDHKLRALLDGRPVLLWSVEAALGAALAETIVVVGDDRFEDLLPDGVSVVANPGWRDGQAGSLQAAVAHVSRGDHEAIVVGVADQPFVGAACWSAVAAASATPIATARFRGRNRPPVRLAREVWRLLPTDGDEGARVLLRGRPELVSPVECHSEPMDVDSEEDLHRAQTRADDLRAVADLLGRVPRGNFEVVVRGESGRPIVIRNHPILDDGTPMPTMYWLCGDREQMLVGRLESAGGVRRAEAEIGLDRIAAAHDRYRLDRDSMLVDVDLTGAHIPSAGVGGTRAGVKCLHAHYAWWLAGGDDPVGSWVADHLDEVDRPDWPAATGSEE